MDIYEMYKNGATSEEVFAAFKKEAKAANERIAKEEAERKAAEKARLAQEKAEKEAAVQKEALLAEARAHLINACVAYSEAYGEEITDEDIKKLEQELIGMEKFLEKMMNMKGGDLDLSGMFGLFGF
jgi:hypothetical protein